MLEAKNLSFSYEKDQVLNDINISFEKGKLTTLLGANGSGKTTIIKCLNKIIEINNGEIKINNKNISDLKQKEIAKKIAMVPQEHNSIFSYKSIDVVLMGITPYLDFAKQPKEKDYNKAKEILDKLNIGDLAYRNYNKLSGGERQLVLIARALMQDTEYILLDEPTSHLDFKNQHLILQKLKKLTNKNKAIITALHDPNLALKYSDKIIIIKDGKILAKGDADKVMTNKNLSKAYNAQIIVNEIANQVEIGDFSKEVKDVI